MLILIAIFVLGSIGLGIYVASTSDSSAPAVTSPAGKKVAAGAGALVLGLVGAAILANVLLVAVVIGYSIYNPNVVLG